MNAVLANFVITAFVAFSRIGGCFLLMPGLSSARVPIQIRLFVAIAPLVASASPNTGRPERSAPSASIAYPFHL